MEGENLVGSGSKECILLHICERELENLDMVINTNKKLSYCWETVRRESMPRIAKMDVEMTT